VERQLLQRVKPDVARRFEVDRVAAANLDPMRLGDPADGLLQIGRVTGFGIEPEQAGLYGQVGSVPMPGLGQGTVEIDPEAGDVSQVVAGVEFGNKCRACASWRGPRPP